MTVLQTLASKADSVRRSQMYIQSIHISPHKKKSCLSCCSLAFVRAALKFCDIVLDTTCEC